MFRQLEIVSTVDDLLIMQIVTSPAYSSGRLGENLDLGAIWLVADSFLSVAARASALERADAPDM